MASSTSSAPTTKAAAQPVLVAAVPLAWGWGLTCLDVGLAVGFYSLSGFGPAARVAAEGKHPA
jgi:hypothetical protein